MKAAALQAMTGLRRPMARAQRVTLFEREVRERLSVPAIDLLIDCAKVLSEGSRSRAATGGSAFYGSTMLTIDLSALAGGVREKCDAAAARRVAAFLSNDARAERRFREIAEREAQRIAGSILKPRGLDVRVRAQGTLVYVDVDVEE